MRRGEDVLVAILRQHRCFTCGGVLVVFHLCPGCRQLVHPGCECHPVVPVEQVQACGLAGGDVADVSGSWWFRGVQ